MSSTGERMSFPVCARAAETRVRHVGSQPSSANAASTHRQRGRSRDHDARASLGHFRDDIAEIAIHGWSQRASGRMRNVSGRRSAGPIARPVSRQACLLRSRSFRNHSLLRRYFQSALPHRDLCRAGRVHEHKGDARCAEIYAARDRWCAARPGVFPTRLR